MRYYSIKTNLGYNWFGMKTSNLQKEWKHSKWCG